MKTNQLTGKVIIPMVLFILCSCLHSFSQSWSITGNANIASGTNYLGTSDANDMVFRSNAIERGRLTAAGEWRFGTSTNYVSIDVNGKLKFTGTQAAYQVAGNKYAFQFSGNPNYGLFFNSSGDQYEFRNSAAAPVFFITASTGAGTFLGSLKVGAYTLPATDGTLNQVLKTNGAGVLTWSADEAGNYSAGMGISIASNIITNTAPDQIVAIAGSNGITAGGAYPNLTISGAGLWSTTGNAGTLNGTNFIGTTDAVDFAFRANNLEGMRLTSGNRRLGLGTTIPSAKLHINAASAEDALRVQTFGITRLYVDGGGGVSIGTTTAGPVDGLYVEGNTGIGTNLPEANLHVYRGNAGTVTANANSLLVLENNANNYINLLTPDANEKGILFGDVTNASDGGIIYNSLNQMLFKTSGNVTRMTLTSVGDLTINGNLSVDGTTLDLGSVEHFSDFGANVIASNSDFVSETDGTANSLGTSANRWVDVWAVDGTINTSDAREKNSIRDLNYGLNEIMKLRAVRFKWNKRPEAGERLGVIAQEVQKILPEAVWDHEFVKDETTNEVKKVPSAVLGINYDAFIPVLIRSIQQQEEIIEAQNKRIETLEQMINQINNTITKSNNTEISNAATTAIISSASLEQNIPNPFNNSTSIRYNLPQKYSSAQIIVTDMNGKTLKQVTLNGSGKGMLNIDASTLASGAYSYSLMIDGKLIDSKQMMIAK